MNSDIVDVITVAIVSNTIAMGALGFLFKSIINNYLAKNVEAFKATLQKENTRLQISYGGIFEQQANALKGLYSRLLDLENGADNLSSIKGWNLYDITIQDSVDFYHANRVLIPASLDEKVHGVFIESRKMLSSSCDGNIASGFKDRFKAAKLEVLKEMRSLLSIELPLKIK